MRILCLIAGLGLCCATAAFAATPVKNFPAWDGKETISAYAQRAGLPATDTLDLGGVKLELVLVPAGSFVMGTSASANVSAFSAKEKEIMAAQEKPHKVTLTQPFYMGKYELTQAQYQKVMGANPSMAKGDDLPVTNISWQDDHEFCKKLSEQCKREVKLPTDAQWEFACRAGTTTNFYNGDTAADLDKIGWYSANAGGKLHPVGQKTPNAWGLYDMVGNARELCEDYFADTLPGVDATDPQGPDKGTKRVGKGGALSGSVNSCRPAYHTDEAENKKAGHIGLRIIVSVTK